MTGPGAGGAGRVRGFSLLELILVLSLAGLIAALVAPTFSGTLDAARLRAGAAEVRGTLASARALAVSQGRARTVALDLDRGTYGIGGEEPTRVLPEGVRFAAARVGAAAREEGDVSVRFFPDGGAEAAEFLLASEGGTRLRVTVEPLTGLAEAKR